MAGKRIHFVGCGERRGYDPSQHGHHAGLRDHRDDDRAGVADKKHFAKLLHEHSTPSPLMARISTNDTLLVLAQKRTSWARPRLRPVPRRTILCWGARRNLPLAGAANRCRRRRRSTRYRNRGPAQKVMAARRIAETIATSPLVKTAFAGRSKLGAHFAAAGTLRESSSIPRVLDIHMAGYPVLRRGKPVDFNERPQEPAAWKTRPSHCGYARREARSGRYLDVRFTAEYVRINASYRT